MTVSASSTPFPAAFAHRRRELTIGRRTLLVISAIVAMWAPLPFIPVDYRLVAAPVSAILTVSVVALHVLWRRNVQLPVFDIGALFLVISTLYAAVPAINYLSAGLEWTALSDNRLQVWNLGPAEVGSFTWPYVGFLAGFAVFYIAICGRRKPMRKVQDADNATFIATLIWLGVVEAVILFVEWRYNINFDPSYLSNGLSEFVAYYQLPYVAQQILHNVIGWRFALKVITAAILLQRARRSRFAAWALIAGLTAETAGSILNMGSRTYAALLLFAVVLLYDRFIRHIRLRSALIAALILVVGFTIYGVARTFGGLNTALSAERRVWTACSDFQTMFASAYGVKLSLENGEVGKPPWQAYWIDAFLLVPSQLLPFKKIEPSTWYYTAIDAKQSSMFGLRAQPVIGFGWIEFLLRGAFLGALMAAVHRWYVRNSASFWKTMIYLYACVWAHYVYRSTMLWPAYFLVYELLPVMLLIFVIALPLRRLTRQQAY